MTKHEIPLTTSKSDVLGCDEPPARNPWLGLRSTDRFFENEEISGIIKRGLFYARAGVPINFQGTAGRGKTSLALAIAERLGRPVSVMAGNDWLDAQDLIGKEVGHTTSSVVDKYIQRVRRSESQVRLDWEHSLLADAMQHGHTLVYDEFTRSSAKANGILLSILEEGVLISTDPVNNRTYLHAHPDFRIILTSNPHDYAGVNATPDALMDRMITFNLSSFSLETEIGIVATRTGLDPDVSARIVGLVHSLQDASKGDGTCSMRAAIMIARIASMRLRSATLSDALLAQIAADVLNGRGPQLTPGQIVKHLTRQN